MKNNIIKNKNIVIITLSIIVFLFILKDIFQYEITSYDNWAYSIFVENLRSNEMTMIMKIITSFGNFLFILSIIIVLFLLYNNKKTIFIIFITVFFIVVFNTFIKVLIHRPRPYGYNLINETNYSFPSGHSMVTTVFYGLLIYLIFEQVKNKKLKIILITLLSLLIVLICISRVYLGVHYLSDTIAGFALSIAYIMVFLMINKNFLKKE